MEINDLFNVEGKVALISGSTGGLGNTFAQALCENGAIVILNGKDKKKLETQVKKYSESGFNVYGYPFDIRDIEQIEVSVESIFNDIGTIDILINNAGVTVRTPLEEFKDEDWRTIIDVNLTGAYRLSKSVIRGMIEQRSGKIINIGSIQCELGRPGITPYAASKGGLKMLTKGMAVEWAKYNIQVNGIGPGYFKTEMTQPLYENPQFDQWLCKRTPANRWGDPSELIGALLFLSSSASDYVSGQMIYVDGGLLAAV
jgi:gluconate 5-dehydrogenase